MSDIEKTHRRQVEAAMRRQYGDAAVEHSIRFRKVSTRYPLRVTEAYDGDVERAAADSDEQVAATVADWEREHGLEPRDWYAIGADEREESLA